MPDYKLSVIIPIFNCEKTLNRAIDSVKRQSIGFSSIELILVDDHSTDRSYDIAKIYKNKSDNVVLLQTESNSGTAGAGRNLGVARAHSEYIMFLDDDDEYLPETCETLVNEISRTGDDFVQGNYIQILRDGSWKKVDKHEKKTLFEQYLPLAWDKIYRKEFLMANGIHFCEGFLAEDESFAALCLAKSEKHHIIDCPVIYYHSDVQSVSNTIKNEFWRKNIYGSYQFLFDEAQRLGIEESVNEIYRETGTFARYATNIMRLDSLEEIKTLMHGWMPVFSYAFFHGYKQDTAEAAVLFPLAAEGDEKALDEAANTMWALKKNHIYEPVKTPQGNIVLCGQGHEENWLNEVDKKFSSTGADALVMGQYPVITMGALSVEGYECFCPPNGCLAVTGKVYDCLGKVDMSLGWAASTDYCIRIKDRGFSVSYCYDLLSPSYEPLPGDVSRIWIDSLLLDYKNGAPALRKATLLELIKKLFRYDPAIGNYSRKILLQSVPGMLFSIVRNHRSSNVKASESFRFKDNAMVRGSFTLPAFPENEPLVSVVIRTHSRPEVLRKTLESLRHQTYSNYEIVLVEDGEPTSGDIIRNDFPDFPITYHPTYEHVGRSAAANLGFSLSKGKYINLLDDDDYFYPEHLSVAVAVAESGNYDMVFLQSISMSINRKNVDPYEFEVTETHFMNFPRMDPFTMSSYCRTPSNGVFFRKDVLSYAVGMREDLDANEDWSLWLRMMTKGKYCVVPFATSCFVVPASEKDRERRMAGYEAYTGKQLDDDMLVFATSGEQLKMYYEGVQNDFLALEAAGLLRQSLEDDIKYWKVKNPQSLIVYADKMRNLINEGSDGVFTAQEFNKFYMGLVCEKLQEI